MREMREQERLNRRRTNQAREAVQSELLRTRLAAGQGTVGETLRQTFFPAAPRPQPLPDVGGEGPFNLEDIAQNPETWIRRYPDFSDDLALEVRGHDEL